MPADVVVTVRMPRSLLHALRERTETLHYADISEQIRSIVRKGCLRHSEPTRQGLEEIKGMLQREVMRETDDVRNKEILASLRSLLERGEPR